MCGGRLLLKTNQVPLQQHHRNLLSLPQLSQLLLPPHPPLQRLLPHPGQSFQPLPLPFQHPQRFLRFLLHPSPLSPLVSQPFHLLDPKLIADRIALLLAMPQTWTTGWALLHHRLNGWTRLPSRLLLPRPKPLIHQVQRV